MFAIESSFPENEMSRQAKKMDENCLLLIIFHFGFHFIVIKYFGFSIVSFVLKIMIHVCHRNTNRV